jgi:hypothetical protein
VAKSAGQLIGSSLSLADPLQQRAAFDFQVLCRFGARQPLVRDTAANVCSLGGVLHLNFSFKNNFFLRETRDGLKAFSGADQSRARGLCAFIADP